MALNYGWEKLYVALRTALVRKGPVQERLASVISEVSLLREEDIEDADLWGRLQKLKSETTKIAGRPGEGSIHATTSQMDDEEAGRWLKEAFDIFSAVAQAYSKSKAS